MIPWLDSLPFAVQVIGGAFVGFALAAGICLGALWLWERYW